jgi:hypothetical protein
MPNPTRLSGSSAQTNWAYSIRGLWLAALQGIERREPHRKAEVEEMRKTLMGVQSARWWIEHRMNDKSLSDLIEAAKVEVIQANSLGAKPPVAALKKALMEGACIPRADGAHCDCWWYEVGPCCNCREPSIGKAVCARSRCLDSEPDDFCANCGPGVHNSSEKCLLEEDKEA